MEAAKSSPHDRGRRLRAWLTPLVRLGLVLCVLLLVHGAYQGRAARERAAGLSNLSLADVEPFFPNASKLGGPEEHGGREVMSESGERLGYVIQTSPESDTESGFSGPTNVLLAVDHAGRIAGVAILSTRDTRDHVELVKRDGRFLSAWRGLSIRQAAERQEVDGVSGATLTSLAIVRGIAKRLGGTGEQGTFAEPLSTADAKQLFPRAGRVTQDASLPEVWTVYEDGGKELGGILRTSPAGDAIVGYQGPTEARIGFTQDGRIVGLVIGRSFDNEPYVGYVRDDEDFRALFRKYSLAELAQIDPKQERIEGVSGATMTSLAVVRSMIAAAHQRAEASVKRRQTQDSVWGERVRLSATIGMIAAGTLLALARRKGAWVQWAFRVLVVLVLGLWLGELLSLAMFAGWAESGVAWTGATGLVLLAAAAVVLPIATKRNVYCSHLCPHGALQQLLPRTLHRRGWIPLWLRQTLRFVRPLLLVWAVTVMVLGLRFSLVDIEPFDAWLWRAAMWPTVLVAAVGLVGTMLSPMAYCRFGCPTGGVLEYLRRSARSNRLGSADAIAVGLLVLSGVLFWASRG